MNNIEEAFSQYKLAKGKIAEFFDCDCVWYNINDLTDDCWNETGGHNGSVRWGEDAEYGSEYSMDVYGTCRWEKDGFVLFVGDDGCGNRDMYLFRLCNRRG